jgi:hypothetical protein
MKLTELAVSDSLRSELIDAIMHRQKRSIRLYAWKVTATDNLAESAFFSQKDATKDWYVTKRIWESPEPGGVIVYSWDITVPDLVKYIKEGCIHNIPFPKDAKIEVATPPSGLHVDIQQAILR